MKEIFLLVCNIVGHLLLIVMVYFYSVVFLSL